MIVLVFVIRLIFSVYLSKISGIIQLADFSLNNSIQKSPLAVLGTKQAMLHARDHSVGDGLEFVAMMNSARLTSEDLSEAMGAKFARRAPTFSKL